MTTPPPIRPVPKSANGPCPVAVDLRGVCGGTLRYWRDGSGIGYQCERCHASWQDYEIAAARAADSAHSAELANGPTCGFCGKPADVWPSKDCEEPQEHTTAVYDCDCGDVVTIADAIASPKQHRRCHLIGSGE